MWTREDLKNRAKGDLRGNYWKAFLVSLLILIVGGSHYGISYSGAGGNSSSDIIYVDFFYPYAYILIAIIVFILAIAILRILIGYIFEVGGRKYFIQLAEGDSELKFLMYGFRESRYFNIVLTMLLRGVYLFLWFLLFIIPGIIKSYAYRMVPYILADNPDIGYNRAIELSNQMTDGQKFEIFVLDLSFIGWFILGLLLLGIGTFFVNPYVDATNAELYLSLRERAIRAGLTTPEELNLVNVQK